MVSSPQSRNGVGKRGGKNNEMSTHMWKEKVRRKGERSKESREE